MNDGGGNDNDNKTLIPRQYRASMDMVSAVCFPAICKKQSTKTVKKRQTVKLKLFLLGIQNQPNQPAIVE